MDSLPSENDDDADPDDPVRLRRRIAALTAEIERLETARRYGAPDIPEIAVRLRNMLANFRAIFQRTLESADSLEQLSLHLIGRFDALARYGVATLTGRMVELEDVVRDELLSAQESDGPRTSIAGPAVELNYRQASLIGLALHELVTNSTKFGALANDGATLSVRWELIGAEADVLHLVWTEGGVAVLASAPIRDGFGRQFIEQALPYQLDARTVLELRPGGIRCEVTLPGVRPGAALDPSGDQIV